MLSKPKADIKCHSERLAKNIIISFVSLRMTVMLLLCILALAFYASPIFAQSATPSASPPIPYTLYPIPSSIPPTSPIYTDLLVHNMFHTFSCLGVGSSIIGQPCLTYQFNQPVLSSVNLSGGALGTTTSLIGALYMHPPIRTADYLASIGENFGIVKEVHAQGVTGSGNEVLKPILTLWKVSRNIAYLIMIVIFVIIGLMVMFRQRINPQTVITAQAALPGLVIGLILITFSYFLAALITDTAFIGTNLVGYYFSAAQSTPQQNLVADTANVDVLTIFGKFVGAIGIGDITGAISVIFDNAPGNVRAFLRVFAGIVSFQLGNQFGEAIPAIGPLERFIDIKGIVAGIVAATTTALFTPQVLGLAFWFIAMVVMIYTMLKLLLRLVNNYISILFLTISAPFHFLAASLPGRQEIATGWALNMLCNILAFPAVMGVFYFVGYLLGANAVDTCLGSQSIPLATCEAAGGKPFFQLGADPALSGAANLPLFGGMDLGLLRILIAFGALLATPAIPDIICRTIGRVTQAGQLIGQEIGAGVGGGQRYLGQAGGGLGAAAQVAGQIPSKRGFAPDFDEKGKFIGYRYSYEPIHGGGAGILERFRAMRKPPIKGKIQE